MEKMSDLRDTLEEAYASADTQSQEPSVVNSENDNPTPAEVVEVINAPSSYKQEFKDSFSTLPPEWQKYLVNREKEVEQGLSRARNQYSWVDKVSNETRDFWQKEGFNDFQSYLRKIHSIAQNLVTNPKATIEELQSIYGVNADNNPLQQQIIELNNRLNQQQGYLRAKENERIKSEFDTFLNAKDEKGNLLHGYYEEVKPEMLKLFQAGLAVNFEDAYNKAIWQNESVRNKIIAEKTNSSIAQKTAIAQKAKSASFDPTSKTEPAPKEYDLREELERNYDKLGE